MNSDFSGLVKDSQLNIALDFDWASREHECFDLYKKGKCSKGMDSVAKYCEPI